MFASMRQRWRFLFPLVRRTAKQFGDHRGSMMAAAVSYYVLFSLFPLILFLVSTFSMFLDSEEIKRRVVAETLKIIPLSRGGETDLAGAIDDVLRARGALSGISLLLTAWSASSMFGVLRTGLSIIWNVERPRPFAQQKLLDLAMVGSVGLLFLLSLGSTIVLQVARRLTESLGALSAAGGLLWEASFYLLPALISLAAFAALYRFVPYTLVRWRDAILGGVVAAVLFEVTKNGFTIYLRNFGNYEATYGALGAVAAFLFWAYISAVIVLLGAEVAAQIPQVQADLSRPRAPTPVSGRPRSRRQALWQGVKRLFAEEKPTEKGSTLRERRR